jgi:uncharacterized membrane protein
MIYLYAYLTVIATLVVVDVVWLGIVTPRFSRPTLGDILTHGANLRCHCVSCALRSGFWSSPSSRL